MDEYAKSLMAGVTTGFISSIAYDFLLKPLLIGDFSLLGVRQLDTVLVGISFFVVGLIFGRNRSSIRIIIDKSDQRRIRSLSEQIEDLTFGREIILEQEKMSPQELTWLTKRIEQLEKERERILKQKRRRRY